jgi:hypothetical protein
MGLCINWTVQAPRAVSAKDATASVGRWRQACLDLPFDEVTESIHFKAPEIKSRLDDRSDRFRWFLIQACAYVAADPTNPVAGSVRENDFRVLDFHK